MYIVIRTVLYEYIEAFLMNFYFIELSLFKKSYK